MVTPYMVLQLQFGPERLGLSVVPVPTHMSKTIFLGVGVVVQSNTALQASLPRESGRCLHFTYRRRHLNTAIADKTPDTGCSSLRQRLPAGAGCRAGADTDWQSRLIGLDRQRLRPGFGRPETGDHPSCHSFCTTYLRPPQTEFVDFGR